MSTALQMQIAIILYGASRYLLSDNVKIGPKVQKPTISQMESAYHGAVRIIFTRESSYAFSAS